MAKAHEPTEETRRLVKNMAIAGIPQRTIMQVIGVAPATLQKHYREELDIGHAQANAKVVESLFQIATECTLVQHKLTACTFWCKTRLGWSEKSELEITGEGGGPVRVLSAEPMSEEQWAKKYGRDE